MMRNRIVGEIVTGMVMGLVYYVIYLILLPQLHRLLGAEAIHREPYIDITLAGFFLAIGAVANITRGTIYSFILSALLKMLGLLSYLFLVSGKPLTMTSAATAGYSLTVSLNPEPVIFVASIWTLATILIDILAMIERLRPGIPGALTYLREALG
ncbi:MAG TPA: hypothetical protein VNL13_01925 [Sulfolobales archaeon]|nr:hypothetical protein [Sulfolobales archaeon]